MTINWFAVLRTLDKVKLLRILNQKSSMIIHAELWTTNCSTFAIQTKLNLVINCLLFVSRQERWLMSKTSWADIWNKRFSLPGFCWVLDDMVGAFGLKLVLSCTAPKRKWKCEKQQLRTKTNRLPPVKAWNDKTSTSISVVAIYGWLRCQFKWESRVIKKP